MSEKRFFGVSTIGYGLDPESEDWVVWYLDESEKRTPIARVRRRLLEMAAGDGVRPEDSPTVVAIGECMRDLVAAAYRGAGATVTEVDVNQSPDTN